MYHLSSFLFSHRVFTGFNAVRWSRDRRKSYRDKFIYGSKKLVRAHQLYPSEPIRYRNLFAIWNHETIGTYKADGPDYLFIYYFIFVFILQRIQCATEPIVIRHQ
jgi:hypothetical protein